jgi:mRNA interferase RelE/StbE
MSSDKPSIQITPWFGRVLKKLKKQEKKLLDLEIHKILKDPEIGVLKKGNLAGIRVHKFKMNQQQQLLAYQESDEGILLIMLGSHENYYRELGKYLQ